MSLEPVELLVYETVFGRRPFEEWLHTLGLTTRQAVERRLARLRRGLFGDAKSVGEGVFELRLHLGPGYRVYFGRQGRETVILVCAGDKGRQRADVERARTLWRDYLRRVGK